MRDTLCIDQKHGKQNKTLNQPILSPSYWPTQLRDLNSVASIGSDISDYPSFCSDCTIISLRHSVNGDFCGHSRFVLWHENLTTFVS